MGGVGGEGRFPPLPQSSAVDIAKIHMAYTKEVDT